jgi:DNA-binding CsgD family transcriptional regulator
LTCIQQVGDWRATQSIGPMYERLLAAMGTEEFGSTVREAILKVTTGARRIYLFEATGRVANSLQYFSCEPGLAELFPLYSRSYLALDPVSEAYRAAVTLSETVVQRIVPSDIASAGFRRRFFEEPGIVERISIVQRGADGWRVLNVARHVSDGCVSDQELAALVNLACLALPMLPLNRAKPRGVQQLSVEQLEERFAMRHPDLTARERQVCALDLGVGKSSVLTYRQRAYQRLRVTSPYQLCSLVSH